MDLWTGGCVAVSGLNLAVAGVLIAMYGGLYRRNASTFTLALVLFAGAFLLQNLLFLYFYVEMSPEFPATAMPFLFAVGLTEGAGLGAVAWTASR